MSLSICKLFAQESHSPYQNHTFRHYDRYVYNSDQRFHTSVKPFLNHQIDSIVNIDSIYRLPVNKKVWDIVFNRSLIQFNKDGFQFTIDPLFNYEMGKDPDQTDISWINTRGFLINGSIGENFSFSTRFNENQAVFNDYRLNIVQNHGVIPGQGRPKDYKGKGYDYAFSEAYINYQAGKYFNFQMGHGKNFIGDGYRSLLLSDNAFSYPFFKITTDIWHIKYMNLWMQHQDFTTKYPYGAAYDKKWASIHYLDWSVTPWLNIGLFEAIIWQNSDSTGHRGFDVNYANPVIFFRPVEFSVGSPDNALMGINGKLTLWKNQIFYGQFMLDEFKLSHIKDGIKHKLNPNDSTINWGWWGNKYAIQAGYKTFDIFNVKHLDIQTEVNYARPFMYSHLSSLKNYGHYNVSLAHPLGSNFLESVSFLRYNYKRLFFEGRFSYAKHGRDTAGLNFGNDIFKSYNDREDWQEFGNELSQAEPVILKYATVSVSYLINPSTNLNVYLSYTNRSESSASINTNQGFITFGIRTSLQNFYYDY
ncbi:MAG: hypothetical protein PF517_17755 [Salinivirgaceae bacterium]|nr:hypothetical protein [Salinivirgaceae bacterium]